MYVLQNSTDLWLSRWEALKKHIDQLLGLVTYTNVPRRAVLQTTLEALRDFAHSHFTFFHDGLNNRGAVKLSRDGSDYDNDFIMRYVIYRIAEDVNILQQSVTDRQSYAGDALELADKLAYAALLPAIRQGIVSPRTQVITYFQKRASIRVVPYTSVALVAVPLISLTQWKDLLATFHEVGHYVYWHGKAAGMTLSVTEKIQQILAALYPNASPPVWLENWAEEIFADAYGALTGGAAIGLNFQHLANQMSPDEFNGGTEESHHHPVPYIRPEIYAQVVEWSGKPTLAGTLRAAWQTQLDQRPEHPQLVELMLPVRKDAPNEPVDVEAVKTVFGQVVKAIFEDCLGLDPAQLDAAIRDFADIPDSTRAGEIYDEHRLKLSVLANTRLPDLELIPQKQNWQDWAAAKVALANPPADGIPPVQWHRLVEADGWNTEGPGGGLLP